MTKLRRTFVTYFDQHRDRIGQPFEVLRKITRRNATAADLREFDREVLPMYKIRFPDGFETAAFPDEIEVSS